MGHDPLRMYLVLRRGAIAELARAGELAGAAAVACLRVFETQPEHAEAIAAWRERPGKVCLRARTSGQWEQVLAEPHTLAGAGRRRGGGRAAAAPALAARAAARAPAGDEQRAGAAARGRAASSPAR